jgi:NADH:ubiquinone oxidoreductase subunit F (NADH-binding)
MTATVDSPALLAAQAPALNAHLSAHGPLTLPAPGALLGVLEASGLTGRGGAGFPAWRKWAAVAAGRRPVVIANAAEGEPASGKDAALLTASPHLVLDGLQLAAHAVGATRVVVYAKTQHTAALRTAIAERAAARWDRYDAEVVTAPPGFLSGEESAVVAAVEGRPALPRDTPVRTVQRGVRGAPTLVQNAETLAQAALIARRGPDWSRDHGTFLATVSGSVARPGVYELPHGATLGGVLDAAGGAAGPLQAVLAGGYHGAWIPADPRIPFTREGLAPYGASPGAGVVIALASGHCGLREGARIADYLASQSAGQCGPCRNGLPRLAGTLGVLAYRGGRAADPAELDRLMALVRGRGACHHPDGSARFVASTLRIFAAETELHLAGRCSGGAR